jgi:hypothetical protein
MVIRQSRFVPLKILSIMKTDTLNKSFDSVKLMRDIRTKISSEISGMTPEQIIEFFRKGSEQFQRSMAGR